MQGSSSETIAPEDLVRWCQRSLPDDPRGFEAFVSRYKGRVFRIAYRLMGNQQEAEDQAQEIFLKVYKNIRHLSEPATVVTWLDRIAVNTCLDALAKQKRRPVTAPLEASLEGDQEAPPYIDTRMPTPEAAALRRELRRCLESTLAELDAPSRVALALRDIEDRSYQEIVEILGVGLSAVKMRIHRARLAFQVSLERICPETWRTGQTIERGAVTL